jgi:hypothetical protein
LLTQLYLYSLRGEKSPKAIRAALKRLPAGSDAYGCAYKDVIERIDWQVKGAKALAKQVLSWITYARRPLTTTELQHAVAVEVGKHELDNENLSEI